ncbi:MAG: helix-turn-helix transcriptional regulator [Acidobacteria bacterium]|nr:helix-turn-helix transcriptional regulator [Acidobacteriota bacterium]
MGRLQHDDLRALLSFLRRLYGSHDLPSFVKHTLSGLLQIIPAEAAAYCEMNPREGTSANWVEPAFFLTKTQAVAWQEVMDQHPALAVCARRNDGCAYTISDFLSRARFHKTALYNEFYRRLGAEEDINLFVHISPSSLIGISLHRGWRKFTESERLLLNLLRPHLVQAWKNARLRSRLTGKVGVLEDSMNAARIGLVRLDRRGQIHQLTPLAEQHLREYFMGQARLGSHLPQCVEQWVRLQMGLPNQDDVSTAPMPLIVKGNGKRLLVRFFSHLSQPFLVLSEESGVAELAAFQRLGLTRRETEVLAWVTRGKTNADIATILGSSPRTVEKHLEHIFQKLGVENRTAAAAAALGGSRLGVGSHPRALWRSS